MKVLPVYDANRLIYTLSLCYKENQGEGTSRTYYIIPVNFFGEAPFAG